MIYHVTEHFYCSSHCFYFNSSMINKNIPFEAAYLNILELAEKTECSWIDLSSNKNYKLLESIKERFGIYNDAAECWKKLLTKPPCYIDKSVSITMCS